MNSADHVGHYLIVLPPIPLSNYIDTLRANDFPATVSLSQKYRRFSSLQNNMPENLVYEYSEVKMLPYFLLLV